MAFQNLVSATIPSETLERVLANLATIKTDLNFLLDLKASEIQSLFKVGNAFAPFLEKAYSVVVQHPTLMPGVFDVDEFKRDYHLAKDLGAISDMLNELATGVGNTLTAVNSDALAGGLDVYAAIKRNSDKVPGLKVAGSEMGEFFKRSKKKEALAK